jgi:hypothetical protein
MSEIVGRVLFEMTVFRVSQGEEISVKGRPPRIGLGDRDSMEYYVELSELSATPIDWDIALDVRESFADVVLPIVDHHIVNSAITARYSGDHFPRRGNASRQKGF